VGARRPAAGILTMADNTVRLTTAGRFWYGNLINAFNDILLKLTGTPPPVFPMHRPSIATSHAIGRLS
jgi:hypothetical protein